MNLQLLGARQTQHHVVVYDNRPVPERPTLTFEPFFIAWCECGWFGLARQSSDEAFKDARTHSDRVDRWMRRPLG